MMEYCWFHEPSCECVNGKENALMIDEQPTCSNLTGVTNGYNVHVPM
jgi:hypothetical protein